jgi:S-adenosylmethionine decarboxylase
MMPVAPDGLHLLAELFGCRNLDDPALVERALRDAVAAAGATLIDLRLHHFGVAQGVTGVALLAESHLSIHTWPEHGYAAIDIFLCGRRHDPGAALAVLVAAFDSTTVTENRICRGMAASVEFPTGIS